MKKALAACVLAVALPRCGLEQPVPSFDDIASEASQFVATQVPIASESSQDYESNYEMLSAKAPDIIRPEAARLVEQSGPQTSLDKVNRLLGGEFAQAQPRQDLRNFLGEPSWVGLDRDVWEISGTTDGVQALSRLVVDYNSQNVAITWYRFGGIQQKVSTASSPYLLGALYFEPSTLVIQ